MTKTFTTEFVVSQRTPRVKLKNISIKPLQPSPILINNYINI